MYQAGVLMRALLLSERLNFPQGHPFFNIKERSWCSKRNEYSPKLLNISYREVEKEQLQRVPWCPSVAQYICSSGNWELSAKVAPASKLLLRTLLQPAVLPSRSLERHCAEISLKTAHFPMHYSTLLQKLTSCGSSYPLQGFFFSFSGFFWCFVPLKCCVLV